MIKSHTFETPHNVHQEMKNNHSVLLVDVREPAEFRDGHAKGATSIPLNSISKSDLQRLKTDWDPQNLPVYLICESGLRALQAAERLYQEGVKHPIVVEGGTNAWEDATLPMMRKKTALPSLERQTQIALGALLLAILLKGTLIHPGFYLLTGIIASGLLIAGLTAKCSLTTLLAKMPWNQQSNSTA